MFLIVAHHYVVNSGLTGLIRADPSLDFNALFLLCLGGWGKIGINCFVLITGYFMCTQHITARKFVKLLSALEFYKILIYAVFVLTGHEAFTLRGIVLAAVPFLFVTDGFVTCYLVFFCFIPFLNILIRGMDERRHRLLLLLLLAVYSVWASLPKVQVTLGYVGWFMVLYMVASYIRLYPKEILGRRGLWGWMSLAAAAGGMLSIVACAYAAKRWDLPPVWFCFVADSNKITALAASLCFFLYFRNLRMRRSRFVNVVASATFGVLLIHANSDAMRQWLWRDLAGNTDWYRSTYLVWHALGVTVAVYVACTAIELLRLRWVERPLLRRFGSPTR